MTSFPATEFGGKRLKFFPSPPPIGEEVTSVVVFACVQGGFLVADIAGRGWCVPSGGLENSETPSETAVRETIEETGWLLAELQEVGSFSLRTQAEVEWAVAVLSTRATEKGPPTGNDSSGWRVVPLDGLPAVYFRWDPFYEAVFNYMAKLAQA